MTIARGTAELRGPHLMLTHVCGDHRVALGHVVETIQYVLGAQDPLAMTGLYLMTYLGAGLLFVPLCMVGLMVAGALTWSLTEYLLHRWVFHYVGPKPWQRRPRRTLQACR